MNKLFFIKKFLDFHPFSFPGLNYVKRMLGWSNR